jgi:hypothetical protein
MPDQHQLNFAPNDAKRETLTVITRAAADGNVSRATDGFLDTL